MTTPNRPGYVLAKIKQEQEEAALQKTLVRPLGAENGEISTHEKQQVDIVPVTHGGWPREGQKHPGSDGLQNCW